MKAYAIQKYRGPLQETDAPEPQAGPEDLLVRIHAASVNPVDARLQEGAMRPVLPYSMPLVLGHDAVGTVLEAGASVKGYAVGDRVFFKAPDGRIGTFAERIAVRADLVAPAPEGLSDAETAALPLVGLTAWQALFELGGMGPGTRLLVHGGSGGVGSMAVQLGRHAGAHVAATAGTRNLERVRELGAETVIDYSTQDFAQELSGYDVVLDTQGGTVLKKSLGVLTPGGVAVGITGPPTPSFAREAGLNPVIRAGITGLSWAVRRRARKLGVRYEFMMAASDGGRLREIARLVEEGALRPLPVREFPFDQTPEALASAERGGKSVVVMPSAD